MMKINHYILIILADYDKTVKCLISKKNNYFCYNSAIENKANFINPSTHCWSDILRLDYGVP